MKFSIVTVLVDLQTRCFASLPFRCNFGSAHWFRRVTRVRKHCIHFAPLPFPLLFPLISPCALPLIVLRARIGRKLLALLVITKEFDIFLRPFGLFVSVLFLSGPPKWLNSQSHWMKPPAFDFDPKSLPFASIRIFIGHTGGGGARKPGRQRERERDGAHPHWYKISRLQNIEFAVNTKATSKFN